MDYSRPHMNQVYVLPILRLTKVSETPGKDFLPVDHHVRSERVKYWRTPKFDKSSHWNTFPRFPIVLNADGSPWEPAVLWLLDRAQANPTKLSSLMTIAQALRDYKLFLDDLGIEWNDFSSIEKYSRPTYIYKTHVENLANSGEIKPSTASRRMSTVIGFYRFAQNDRRLSFSPVNAPWQETRFNLQFCDAKGFKQYKEVTTTDLKIRVPPNEEPLSRTIDDGRKLRPLNVEEQKTLVAALQTLGHTEFTLAHYLGILTGAREMTALTLRMRDFMLPPTSILSWPYKLRCGPGTGIDTKFDKSNVFLIIPRVLFQMLHMYAISERARKRRTKSRLGENPQNYLFLTSQGNPYYEGKDDRNEVTLLEKKLKRSSVQGQGLREFITKRVIPEVRKTLPQFQYKFHDTRATFGLNWVDHVMGEENSENEKYHWAMDQLRKLMWHRSTATTEKYLEYRSHTHRIDNALKDWSSHLLSMVEYDLKQSIDTKMAIDFV